MISCVIVDNYSVRSCSIIGYSVKFIVNIKFIFSIIGNFCKFFFSKDNCILIGNKICNCIDIKGLKINIFFSIKDKKVFIGIISEGIIFFIFIEAIVILIIY